jgi:hypothetical protein
VVNASNLYAGSSCALSMASLETPAPDIPIENSEQRGSEAERKKESRRWTAGRVETVRGRGSDDDERAGAGGWRWWWR